jgi:hypothetical protein
MTQQGVTVTGPAPGWAAIRFQPARKGNLKVTVGTTSRPGGAGSPGPAVAFTVTFVAPVLSESEPHSLFKLVCVTGINRDCHRLGVNLSLGPPAAVAGPGPGRRRQLEIRAQAVPSRIEYFNPRWQRGCCSLGNWPPALVFKGPGWWPTI